MDIKINISVKNSVQKYISARINKARNSYCSLRNIWKSNVYSIQTNVRIFNSNVISVLPYGCQSWRVNTNDMNKLDVFQKCLRRIYNIIWPDKISNEYMYRRTKSLPISCQIKKYRMRWSGHVLRMRQDHIPRVALRWTPTGKMIKGWSQDYMNKIYYSLTVRYGSDYGGVKVIAQDRNNWRNDIVALCPTWGWRG